MKLLFVVMFLCTINKLHSQDLKEIFSSSEIDIEFVGLDFSQVKMVGFASSKTPNEIQEYYFDAWNNLLIKETQKYDIKRAFKRSKISYDLSIVHVVNKKRSFGNMLTDVVPQAFSLKDIQQIVDGYNTSEMQAKYGLSFVVHSFNRFEERGYIYVVLFDVNSKKVLFAEPMSGAAGGLGFRNYWARTIYNVLEDIRDYKFRRWQKQLAEY
ncbi:hypothetical protein [Aureispira anguillae]|uniref:Uncharacterized protein n=1 Tax=Aureispira anguillae TaxID=2864201 RepID=A0A916DQR6_9BACT|nr:hypothetical protein [Aureispira anguillae]BDS09867.1 hypothetical protein AsAng_0005720 [Aureispira anguillae]